MTVGKAEPIKQGGESKKLNLLQKLAEIRSMSDVVSKSKRGYGYSYEDITEILANVTAGMAKHGVSLIPSIKPGTPKVEQVVTIKTKMPKQGGAYDERSSEMMFTAEMEFRWVNDDNPNDYISVPWFVAGAQSDPSQALGSGLTYTTRQFLKMYFQIASTDEGDVDAFRSKQKEAAEAEERAVAAAIISSFDTEVRAYLADNQDMKDEVGKFVKRYIRNGDYTKIIEPVLAGKLRDDFKKQFKTEEKKEGNE